MHGLRVPKSHEINFDKWCFLVLAATKIIPDRLSTLGNPVLAIRGSTRICVYSNNFYQQCSNCSSEFQNPDLEFEKPCSWDFPSQKNALSSFIDLCTPLLTFTEEEILIYLLPLLFASVQGRGDNPRNLGPNFGNNIFLFLFHFFSARQFVRKTFPFF